MLLFALTTTTIEAKAYTNAEVSDPVLRRMGKQLGWSDEFIKKEGEHITYQITGINDGRMVYTSFDGYPYGVTDNNNQVIRKLSMMICKQHANRMETDGELVNQSYVLAFSNAPTCTTGGWVWLGCKDDAYSYWHYHHFKEQLVPDEEHRIDLSSHYGYYQEALGHEYNYDEWSYDSSNGIENGMRYHKCNYCDAYTDTQYACIIKAGKGIAETLGEGWYDEGDTVIIMAEPKAGYIWDKWIWSGNGKSTEQIYTFSIDKAYEFIPVVSAKEYRIHFDANGGDGDMEDITLIYDVPQRLPVHTFYRNNGYGDSVFLGWNTNPDAKTALYEDEAEIVNVTETNGKTVILYAIWDDCPWIEVEDLYFSLKQAQSGHITQEKLLSYAKAYGGEYGKLISSGIDNERGTSFTIIDYDSVKFTSLESETSVLQTFQVVDSAGNSYNKTIQVYIIDTEVHVIKPLGTTRFINEKYYYEAFETGGLEENSIWKSNIEYRAIIEQAFENERNKTPIKTYHFTQEYFLKMK